MLYCYSSSESLLCVMQEKEQELIESCAEGDLDECKRLVGSGVSVKCRDKVFNEITEISETFYFVIALFRCLVLIIVANIMNFCYC